MDVTKGANIMSAGILDGFQTIIPTAAAVLSEKRQILRLTQQEVADRLSGSFDFYNKKTSDMLYEYAVPSPPNLYTSMG